MLVLVVPRGRKNYFYFFFKNTNQILKTAIKPIEVKPNHEVEIASIHVAVFPNILMLSHIQESRK